MPSRYQLSLKQLLAAVTGVAILLTVLVLIFSRWQTESRRREYVHELMQLGPAAIYPNEGELTLQFGTPWREHIPWGEPLPKSYNVTNEDLRVLNHFAPELRALSLIDTSISDKGIELIQELPELRQLSLRDTAVTDGGLEHLALLRSLQLLDIRGTKITPDGVVRFKRVRPDVKVLY